MRACVITGSPVSLCRPFGPLRAGDRRSCRLHVKHAQSSSVPPPCAPCLRVDRDKRRHLTAVGRKSLNDEEPVPERGGGADAARARAAGAGATMRRYGEFSAAEDAVPMARTCCAPISPVKRSGSHVRCTTGCEMAGDHQAISPTTAGGRSNHEHSRADLVAQAGRLARA
jgi:hypothetical protein